MNERIIIVEDCVDCQYSALGFLTKGHVCLHDIGEPRDCPDEGTPDWCQLPPLPEEADETPYDNAPDDSFIVNSFEAGFAKGWNMCLNAITGDEEE